MTTRHVIVAVAAGVLAGEIRAEESIEHELVRQAPKLIKIFKEHGYHNIGVLKFLVARGEQATQVSDNVGTLNMLLARRLEMALILANAPRQPVGIVANASAVAQRTAGANHL